MKRTLTDSEVELLVEALHWVASDAEKAVETSSKLGSVRITESIQKRAINLRALEDLIGESKSVEVETESAE